MWQDMGATRPGTQGSDDIRLIRGAAEWKEPKFVVPKKESRYQPQPAGRMGQGPLPGRALEGPELPPALARLLERFPQLRRRPHPMLAHFPTVFLLGATFFSLLFVLTGDRAFDDTAFYCLGGGLLTLPATAATGLFTHWLNFYGGADQTVRLEKALSAALMVIAAAAWMWRWLNPRVLMDLAGVNLIYLFLVLSLTPLVTANGYFGGMVTFPLEEEAPPPGG
jgi:uncharacterized membrane protein